MTIRRLLSTILCLTLAVSISQAEGKKEEQKEVKKEISTTVTDSLQSISAASQTVDLLVKEQMQRLQDSLAQETMRLKIENTTEAGIRKTLEKELAQKKQADSIRLLKIKDQITRSKFNAIGYPIVVADDTIRMIYTSLGALTAAERAEITSRKIEDVADVFFPTIDSLVIAQDGATIEIMFKDNVLSTISQADALWENRDPQVIAGEVSKKIHESIIKHKEQTSLTTILKQIGLSVLVIVVCFLLVKFINSVFKNKIRRFFLSKIGTWFKGWTFRDYQIMNAKRQVRFVLFVIRTLRWTTSIFLIYIALPILFSIFPFTQRLAATLFGWVTEPITAIFKAIFNYLPDLFVILVIWITMRYVVRGVKYLMNEIAIGNLKITGFYPDWAKATYNILRFILYAFSFVMIFPYLPYADSDIFKGVSVFVGIIFSLGSSSVISNIVAGMVITYMRPFRIGDHIKIGDVTGDVLEKTPFVTRIKTHKQEVVTIPNGNVLSTQVVNYSTSAQEAGVIFHVTITIGYDVPWRDVHAMMLEAADRSEYILKDPAPFVLQTSLDDFYVSYQICAYSKNPEKQATIYSQLHQNIQDVFNERDIEIMSPHYRAQRDGNCTTVPEAHRAPDYTVPPFNILTRDK